MSLVVAIRAAQGLVLATDSMTRRGDAVFFSARKLFTFERQPYVAVAVCGLLSLGRGELRSVAVLLDDFATALPPASDNRMATYQIAGALSAYLCAQWQALMLPEDDDTLDLVVAGYDAGMPFGEIYRLTIPSAPEPQLQRLPSQPFFLAYWGATKGLAAMTEPYCFPFDIMPLSDCRALAEDLIATTACLESRSSKLQRSGGPVQLVTITQADGALASRSRPRCP